MSKRKSSTKSTGNYVFGLPSFAQESIIPPQNLYSDTAYWYNTKKLELAWERGSTKGISDFFAPFKGSPYGYASTLPAWYGENINQVLINEYEFSSNVLVRTMYSEDFDGLRQPGVETGSLWCATRDVVTGQFSIKNGKLSGTAFTLTRQYVDDGSPNGQEVIYKGTNGETISYFSDYPSQEIFHYTFPGGFSLSSYYKTGLGVLYPYDGGWEDVVPEIVTGKSTLIHDRPVDKFFPDGWELNPFGNNLI